MDLFFANLLMYWDGRADFKKAFLVYFLAGNSSLLFLIIYILVAFNLSFENNLGKVFLSLFLIIFSLYYFLTLKFVWACAKNTKLTFIFYVARFAVIAFIMAFIFSLAHIIYYLV